ncbi:hypothetical protein OIU84_019521 [Salix udensis]|uniref:Uncharacterized protein n=1 Tax=Salix udensis TaxID=889485 RepID=A0AAD6PKE4_9ROSI|nr:hypothetical protein OIU84_019521 [Salix udensis]
MKTISSTLIKLLVLLYLSVLSVSQEFDFFYFVQQWPGSYCDTVKSCCYPTTGKPEADFGIHGLWPNYNDGNYPSNCDANSTLRSKKGCRPEERHAKELANASLPERQRTLNLRRQVNLLQALKNAGINPDGESYSLISIRSAIQEGVGFTPWIECNADTSRNSQLYQIYLCVDTSGKALIDCPVFPRGKCDSEIEFPSF